MTDEILKFKVVFDQGGAELFTATQLVTADRFFDEGDWTVFTRRHPDMPAVITVPAGAVVIPAKPIEEVRIQRRLIRLIAPIRE